MLEMEALQGERTVFNVSPTVHRRREIAHPVPTNIFLNLSPDMAILGVQNQQCTKHQPNAKDCLPCK